MTLTYQVPSFKLGALNIVDHDRKITSKKQKLGNSLPPVRRCGSGCTEGIFYADYPILHFISTDSHGVMKLTFDPNYETQVKKMVQKIITDAKPVTATAVAAIDLQAALDVEAEECPICFEPLRDPISPCKVPQHRFCSKCFDGMRRQGDNACPTCRGEMLF